MNSPSEVNGTPSAAQRRVSAAPGMGPVSPLFLAECNVAPFEFRMLSDEETEKRRGGQQARTNASSMTTAEGFARTGFDCASGDAMHRSAVDTARQEGLRLGEHEGRRMARVELEEEMRAAVARDRERVVAAIQDFRGARVRYFSGVEQQVVKLALAIAARVLHREAQIDPLLLSGVVRVALEKIADRSEVVLRVAAMDVEPWERIFQATEPAERPRIAEDAQLARGECVLETRMGTVELGIGVQLEEIEKGFFDLLNHRPVQ